MPASATRSPARDAVGAAARLSDAELRGRLGELFAHKAVLEGAIVVLLGEVARRQAYRAEGATSAEAWAAERFGVSGPSARAYAAVGEVAPDLPHLVGALCAGEVSFDKVRTVAAVATPETEGRLSEAARACTVRELAELARAEAPAGRRAGPERRSLRCNDGCHTLSVQLGAASYAEVRAVLEARARALPSDGETRWDERLCDAFVELVAGAGRAERGRGAAASPYLVVAHVSLAALVEGSDGSDGSESEGSELVGELERAGLVSAEVVRRLACDATLVVALDDDVGHTMYEGRARRVPTEAQRREVLRRDRHCRFPGCANVTFTNIHHVLAWKPGGRTDLDNLALLCVHHHHVVHSKGWRVSGDANEELCFVGPQGRAMASRPSPLWTTVTAPTRAGKRPSS
jgi:hypothetical protein